MDSKCKIVQRQIGGSRAGEFGSEIHEHLKYCKDCDQYAQDIIRLEKVFKNDAISMVQPHQQIWKKSKWSLMTIAAIMIIFLPNPFQQKSRFQLAGKSGNDVIISSDFKQNSQFSIDTIYYDLAQININLALENNDIWEQLDDMEWPFDAYSQSMDVIQQWEFDELELSKT